MTSMIVESNLELRELAKIIDIPDDLYDEAGFLIDHMADEHTHMNVSEFVDMCLNIARVKESNPFSRSRRDSI